jgi:hypothetical protein
LKITFELIREILFVPFFAFPLFNVICFQVQFAYRVSKEGRLQENISKRQLFSGMIQSIRSTTFNVFYGRTSEKIA